jgi:hypothetical protein
MLQIVGGGREGGRVGGREGGENCHSMSEALRAADKNGTIRRENVVYT